MHKYLFLFALCIVVFSCTNSPNKFSPEQLKRLDSLANSIRDHARFVCLPHIDEYKDSLFSESEKKDFLLSPEQYSCLLLPYGEKSRKIFEKELYLTPWNPEEMSSILLNWDSVTNRPPFIKNTKPYSDKRHWAFTIPHTPQNKDSLFLITFYTYFSDCIANKDSAFCLNAKGCCWDMLGTSFAITNQYTKKRTSIDIQLCKKKCDSRFIYSPTNPALIPSLEEVAAMREYITTKRINFTGYLQLVEDTEKKYPTHKNLPKILKAHKDWAVLFPESTIEKSDLSDCVYCGYPHLLGRGRDNGYNVQCSKLSFEAHQPITLYTKSGKAFLADVCTNIIAYKRLSDDDCYKSLKSIKPLN